MVRPPCCDKLNVKRGHWTEEEDAKTLAHGSKHGTGNWTAVPKKAGLRRSGKSCRLRWTNHPRPDLRHENFTSQEEELIIRLHSAIGSRWSIIAQQLPGRTDSDVKNYWNTKLRKKLSDMGIDPVTHKPFSQILADYGNINGRGLPKSAATRMGSLNRDPSNTFAVKSEQEGYPKNFNDITHPAMGHPIQDGFLNKNSSLDLLAQLQAITLVATTAETKTPHGDHCSSASSSSSSSSSSNFSWQDFLLEEPFLLPPDAQEGNVGQNEIVLLQSGSKREEQITERNFSEVEEMSCDYSIKGFEPPSSNSDSSFVEAMLDRQNDMLSEEFPSGLLEEPFLY